MEILGSIQGENVAISDRDRMQRQMREFIGDLPPEQASELAQFRGSYAYKVHFWRPFFGSKVDSLIEFRAGDHDAWYARANGADAWRAFSRALGSLRQLVLEIDIREDGNNANREGNPNQKSGD